MKSNPWVYRCWCVLLLWAAAWGAQAQTLAVERAVWVDASGRVDVQAVATQAFVPAPNVVSEGYTDAHVWLRVTVPPTDVPDLLVVVKPTYLDVITLYTPPHAGIDAPLDASGQWQVRRQGDHFAFNARERHDLFNTFRVFASATQPTVFYVRIQSTSNVSFSVNVSTARTLETEEQLLYMGVGTYVGLVLVLLVFSVYRWLLNPDVLWGLNAVVQSCWVMFILIYMGFTLKHISPDTPGWWGHLGTSVLVCVTLFLLMLYYRQFTIAFQAPRWLVNLLSVSLLALPLQLWLIFHGEVRSALELNSILLIIRSIMGVGVAFLLVIDDKPLRYMIRGVYFGLAIYGPWFALPIMGYGEITEWHLYPPVGNLLSAVMQIVVLTRRDWLLNREKTQLEARIQQTEQELAWEQQRLAQSASFMGMLLHELKNPLASIRVSTLNLMQGRSASMQEQQLRLQRIHQSIDGIDAVLERCRQVDQFEQGQWAELQQQRHDLVALFKEWQTAWPLAQRLHLIAPPKAELDTDAGFLKIIVNNLIDNALAYSPPYSMVTVQIHQATSPSAWVLTVRNRVGKAGVPDPQKVFTKYYRSASAHHRTGSGLGLFLVKNLAEMLGGHLSFCLEAASSGASSSDTQVVFELRLPCPS